MKLIYEKVIELSSGNKAKVEVSEESDSSCDAQILYEQDATEQDQVEAELLMRSALERLFGERVVTITPYDPFDGAYQV